MLMTLRATSISSSVKPRSLSCPFSLATADLPGRRDAHDFTRVAAGKDQRLRRRADPDAVEQDTCRALPVSGGKADVAGPAALGEGAAGKRLPFARDAPFKAIARRREIDRDAAPLDPRHIARGREPCGEAVGFAAHAAFFAGNGEHDSGRGERHDRQHHHEFDEGEAAIIGTRSRPREGGSEPGNSERGPDPTRARLTLRCEYPHYRRSRRERRRRRATRRRTPSRSAPAPDNYRDGPTDRRAVS